MICTNSNRLTWYVGPQLLACRKQSLKFLVISTVILLCMLQLIIKVCYRVAKLHEGTTYSQFRSVNVDIKRLKKVGQALNKSCTQQLHQF